VIVFVSPSPVNTLIPTTAVAAGPTNTAPIIVLIDITATFTPSRTLIVTNTPTITPSFTLTPSFTVAPSNTPPPSLTPTSTETPTTTPTFTETPNPIITQTAQVTLTAQAALQELNTVLRDNNIPFFGPKSGSLRHFLADVISEEAGIELADFVVEAQFDNPYGADEGRWDYGFFLRVDENSQYRVIIASSKRFALAFRQGAQESQLVQNGDVPDLRVGAGESNVVRVLVKGVKGYLVINDVLIAELDLSAKQTPGDILIVTGALGRESQKNGALTKYQNFAVRKLLSN
jgi:hypothetical protein